MATTFYGRPDAETTEPETPDKGPALALDQMTLAIEDGLLMVFGPEGDPVPPPAFADAAALRPDVPLRLPDGIAAPASRIAEVLGAQTHGRADAAGPGAEWILAMLRDCGRPEAAAAAALEAERTSCVLAVAENELTVTCATGIFQITDVAPPSVTGDAMGLFLGDEAPISVAGVIGLMRERSAPAGQPGADGLTLRGTIELRADGLWLGVPGLAAHGGGVHLARWATSAPNGPVVRAALSDGRAASLADLIGFGLAAGNEIEAGEHHLPTDTADVLTARGDDPGLSADRQDGDPGDAPIPEGPGEALHDTFSFTTAEPDRAPDDRTLPYEQALLSGGMSAAAGPELPDVIADDHIDLPEEVPGQLEIAHATEPADAEQADIDPDSILLIVIRGVPEDAMLSAGMRDDDGSWSVLPLDLPDVMISLGSRGSEGGACGEARDVDGDLDITGIALDEHGVLVAISETVPLSHYLDDPAQPQAVAAAEANEPAGAPEPCEIALEVDPRAWAGERFDALVIRDLPSGAHLSAGTYDPEIDAWVLRPQDLSALKVRPPAGLRVDFTATLMGVALRPGGANAARILARLPVTLA